jgi:uncharacterized Zn-binding protein involved in type VI secretion
MAAIWITPGFTFNATEGNGAITPIPCTVTINGGTPILEGSVVAPHGSHTGPITIDTNLGPPTILINGLRIATESSTASCGDGIDPSAPKTLSTTVTI